MATIETTPSAEEWAARVIGDISQAVAAGDLARAQQLAGAAIMRGVRHPTCFNARGLWMQQTGRHDLALEDFQRALALKPNDPVILNAIGMSLLKLNRIPEAIKALDAAIAADPQNAQSHYRRGLISATAGNHEAAQAAYERAVEIDPNHAEATAS